MWCSPRLLLFTAWAALGGSVLVLQPSEPLSYKSEEFGSADTPFQPSIAVNGREVSCAVGAVYNNFYPGRMYTCRNISVDGTRIAYSLMVKGNDQHICGSEKGSNSLYWLCVALINSTATAHGRKLSAAYVTEAHCDGQQGDRVRFVHTGESSYWEDSQSSDGYMLALQCLTDENVVDDYS